MPISKRRQAILAHLAGLGRAGNKSYTLSEATEIFKLHPAKFDETVEVSVNLGIDTRKSDQSVRGATVLPHGTGKSVRVAVFTQGANVEAAKAAGADLVGMDDLAQKIQAGEIEFDVVIASPDAMGVVGRLGQILGPRGLMPNPKVGTVAVDVGQAVRNAKGGQVRYRADKTGIVHCAIGKMSFETKALSENLAVLLDSLRKTKPSTSKGVYMKKVTISTTMGPGLMIDQASIGI